MLQTKHEDDVDGHKEIPRYNNEQNMKLTRRDALYALATAGSGGGVSIVLSELSVNPTTRENNEFQASDIRTIHALAEVVYRSSVNASYEFVETYVQNLQSDRQNSILQTIKQLNTESRRISGSKFYEIEDASKQDAVLQSLGVMRVRSKPDGTVLERIRFHLVNSLLFALYASPKGSQFVGIDNPPGHPGGFAAYTEQPEESNE